MKILILEDNKYLSITKTVPLVGVEYYLEDATKGTHAQRKAIEALITVYWQSDLSPYYDMTRNEFRDCIKRDLGAGFEAFIYVDIHNEPLRLRKVKTKEEIPIDILKQEGLAVGKLKSLGRYTKKERMTFLDNLIREMLTRKVSGKKFDEILDGMGGWA